MVIGEEISSDFNYLVKREEEVKRLYEKYCRQHNRILNTEFFITSSYPLLFLLKYKLYESKN
jgi:hypothetical protein